MSLRPALLLSSLLALPLLAIAQPPAPPPGGAGPMAMHHGPPSPERMTEHLRTRLDLSEEQTVRVRALTESFAADLKKLHDSHEQKLREVLTPEQFAKFQAMREERRGRRHDPPQPPQPPAPAQPG